MVSEPEARRSHAEACMSPPTPATQSFKAHTMVETCLSGDESDSPATDDINQIFFDDSVIQLPGHGLSVQGNDWPGEPQDHDHHFKKMVGIKDSCGTKVRAALFICDADTDLKFTSRC